ncbi:MAG TPA: PKD domain-containing protein [Bacteroidia bacterium]
MKTTLQKLKGRLLATGLAVMAVAGVQAQCAISTTVTNQGQGTIDFTNQSTFTPGWDAYTQISYGDGTSTYGIGANFSHNHTYTANGVYLVSSHLFAYDPADSSINCSTTVWDSVFVNDIACSVTATSIYSNQSGSNSLVYNFSSNVNTSQSFFMGDWIITDSTGNYVYSQSGYNLNTMTYTFPIGGPYHIGFSASSYDSLTANYCSDSVYTTIFVTDPPIGCNLQVNVNVTPTGGNSAVIWGYANNFYTYSFILADNQYYTNVDSVNHTFPGPGSYNVCYYAEDSTQATYCYDSICVIYTVGGGNPVSCNAGFYLWEDSTNVGLWHGINYSSGSGALTYMWDFGDGSTSTLAYPTHTYAIPGNYIICLTIADANGCSSSTCDSSAAFRMSQQMSTNSIIGSLTVTAPAVGIAQNNSVLVETKVFPNPMTDASVLTFNSSLAANAKVEVVNVLGAVVASENVMITKGNNEIKLNTGSLVNGVYYINVIAENRVLQTVKAIK